MDDTEIENRIEAGEFPAAISIEAWNRKLKIVQEENIQTFLKLSDYLYENNLEDSCALCYYYVKCNKCPLNTVDRACIDEFNRSTYEKTRGSMNNAELIEKLRLAEQLEMKNNAIYN